MTQDETRGGPKDRVAVCPCGAEYHEGDPHFGEDPWRSPDYARGLALGRRERERLREELADTKETYRRESYDAGKAEAERAAQGDLSQARRAAFELGRRAGLSEIHVPKKALEEEILRGVVRHLHAAGVRQVDLAMAIGRSQSTISRMVSRSSDS